MRKSTPTVGEPEPEKELSTCENEQQETSSDAFSFSAAPASMHMQYPPPVSAILKPVGFLNGQVVYIIGGSDAPPPETIATNESEVEDPLDGEQRPYVKKPPNAFMVFMKEQRPKVKAELRITNSAAVNTILGHRWKSLSQEEQAPYFERANLERQLHEQRHPEWSSRQNYGKKKRRETFRTAFRFTVPVPKAEEEEDPICTTPPPSPVVTALTASAATPAAAVAAAPVPASPPAVRERSLRKQRHPERLLQPPE